MKKFTMPATGNTKVGAIFFSPALAKEDVCMSDVMLRVLDLLPAMMYTAAESLNHFFTVTRKDLCVQSVKTSSCAFCRSVCGLFLHRQIT